MTRESFPAIPRLSVGAAALAVGGNMHAVTTVPRVAEYPRPVARQIDKDGFAVGAAQVSAGAAPRPGSGQREPSPSPRPGGWPGDRARTHDRAAQALDRHHAQAADVVTPWVKRRTSAMSSFGKFHSDPVRAGAGPNPRNAPVAREGVSEVGAPPAINSRSNACNWLTFGSCCGTG